MEIIQALLTRIRRTGVLFIIGLILIIYIGLGFVYWQQGARQRELAEQTAKLSAVMAKPLPPITELQAEREAAKRALVPKTASEYIAILVGIAKKSGINTDEGAGKFRVPPVAIGSRKVGGGNYQLLSFRGISVSGNYTDVMTFIADLDSGETLKTMVLTGVQLDTGSAEQAETQATVDVDIYTKP
ncbi:MAG: hypothetical protein HY663_00855 [Chloroflexi bacterium]|nr:hypothetical protein [Chloroflexota bacterium]